MCVSVLGVHAPGRGPDVDVTPVWPGYPPSVHVAADTGGVAASPSVAQCTCAAAKPGRRAAEGARILSRIRYLVNARNPNT